MKRKFFFRILNVAIIVFYFISINLMFPSLNYAAIWSCTRAAGGDSYFNNISHTSGKCSPPNSFCNPNSTNTTSPCEVPSVSNGGATDCSKPPHTNPCGDDQCPAQLTCFTTQIFPKIIQAAFEIIGSIIVIMIIWAGIKFLMSGGDAKQVEGARNILTYAIIGLVIVLGSYFIINVIAFVTGVHCIKFFGFTNCQ